MKIALAQIESIDGDIDANIARHLAAVLRLRAGDAGLVVFPELSLTNYAPGIAARAAIDADDPRLAVLEDAASELGAGICLGLALECGGKPAIAALLLAPGQPRRVVPKAYLHEDEMPLFAPGSGRAAVLPLAQRVALAICFDISVDAHVEQAASQGMDLYLASVAKTVDGMVAARERLRALARRYRITVLAVNSVGRCEGRPAGGGSMIIGSDGRLVEALDAHEQAILIYDTALGEARRLPLETSRS